MRDRVIRHRGLGVSCWKKLGRGRGVGRKTSNRIIRLTGGAYLHHNYIIILYRYPSLWYYSFFIIGVIFHYHEYDFFHRFLACRNDGGGGGTRMRSNGFCAPPPPYRWTSGGGGNNVRVVRQTVPWEIVKRRLPATSPQTARPIHTSSHPQSQRRNSVVNIFSQKFEIYEYYNT